MSSKDKNERLSLALRKNLKKRKIFQKKNKKKNKYCQFSPINGLEKCPKNTT